MSFEESLIHNASPTLASIKVANLYNFHFATMKECARTIKHFNSVMNAKGIYIELLKRADDFYLIYVYRKSHLEEALCNPSIREFLYSIGYPKDGGSEAYLDVMKKRLALNKEFPHEIGVFLGYPLSDVISFIETKGKGCLVCGDWKAYHDEQTARCLFGKYKHCKEVYVRTYRNGRAFYDLVVRA